MVGVFYPVSSSPNTRFSLVSGILSWKNPIRTGVVFAIGNLFFYLVTFRGYSVIQLLSYISLLLLTLSFVYVNGRDTIHFWQTHQSAPRYVTHAPFLIST